MQPILRTGDKEDEELSRRLVERLAPWLDRLTALVIGPGLGRNVLTLSTTAHIIQAARERGLPLVIDGDGLFLLKDRPELVRGYDRAVLTPNVVEFKRLWEAVLPDANMDACEEPGRRLAEAYAAACGAQRGSHSCLCA